MFQLLGDFVEGFLRWLVVFLTGFLPVKVIRDERGVPFLYRYHLFALSDDGPGMCIHRFVRSDPDRGYHDHPWKFGLSFIFAGGYEERILDLEDRKSFTTYNRPRFSFNLIDGRDSFHRVMLDEGSDAWSFFVFSKRCKRWGMIDLDGKYHAMSREIKDADGGWWRSVGTGYKLDHHVEHPGRVVATTDVVVLVGERVLLIKRGKDPYKDSWAFPGGRIEQKDDNIEEAAARELMEETNLVDLDLKFYGVVGDNRRDPRGFCLSVVYVAKLDEIPDDVRAGDDAVDYQWFSLDELPEMAFDHREILSGVCA